jgi:hypothetical protein
MIAVAWPGTAAQRHHHVGGDVPSATPKTGKVDCSASVRAVAQPGRLASDALAAGSPAACEAQALS